MKASFVDMVLQFASFVDAQLIQYIEVSDGQLASATRQRGKHKHTQRVERILNADFESVSGSLRPGGRDRPPWRSFTGS